MYFYISAFIYWIYQEIHTYVQNNKTKAKNLLSNHLKMYSFVYLVMFGLLQAASGRSWARIKRCVRPRLLWNRKPLFVFPAKLINLSVCVCASFQVSRLSGRGQSWTRSLLTPHCTWSNTMALTASTAWSCTTMSGWWGWRCCPTEWVRNNYPSDSLLADSHLPCGLWCLVCV